MLKADKVDTISIVPSTATIDTFKAQLAQTAITVETPPPDPDFKAKPTMKTTLSGKNLILTTYLKVPLQDRVNESTNS